jgi:hypothetical protein
LCFKHGILDTSYKEKNLLCYATKRTREKPYDLFPLAILFGEVTTALKPQQAANYITTARFLFNEKKNRCGLSIFPSIPR